MRKASVFRGNRQHLPKKRARCKNKDPHLLHLVTEDWEDDHAGREADEPHAWKSDVDDVLVQLPDVVVPHFNTALWRQEREPVLVA